MFQILFLVIVIDTIINIVFNTLRNIFNRRKLLTERKRNHKIIGYARAISNDFDSLNEQVSCLKNFGCNYIFSEILSLNEENRPEFDKALEKLSRGDQIVFTKLDRAFKSKYDCIKTIHQLLNKGIDFCTVSGFCCSNYLAGIYPEIFNILFELEILEKDILIEKKRNTAQNILIKGKNIGGRPKIGVLKEDLVIRLRKEGYSYRSIRSQTGIALSTIRRIILEYAASEL